MGRNTPNRASGGLSRELPQQTGALSCCMRTIILPAPPGPPVFPLSNPADQHARILVLDVEFSVIPQKGAGWGAWLSDTRTLQVALVELSGHRTFNAVLARGERAKVACSGFTLRNVLPRLDAEPVDISFRHESEIGPALMGWLGRLPYRPIIASDFMGDLMLLRRACLTIDDHADLEVLPVMPVPPACTPHNALSDAKAIARTLIATTGGTPAPIPSDLSMA